MADVSGPEAKTAYDRDIYLCVYRSIVQRIGQATAVTITRMTEEDYGLYEPKEAMDRIITPITGLFGSRMMRGIIVSSLSASYGQDGAERMADELLQ